MTCCLQLATGGFRACRHTPSTLAFASCCQVQYGPYACDHMHTHHSSTTAATLPSAVRQRRSNRSFLVQCTMKQSSTQPTNTVNICTHASQPACASKTNHPLRVAAAQYAQSGWLESHCATYPQICRPFLRICPWPELSPAPGLVFLWDPQRKQQTHPSLLRPLSWGGSSTKCPQPQNRVMSMP